MQITILHHGLSIQFDTYTNDYPRQINVKWYRDSTLLYNVDFTVDSANYFCDQQVEAYNKVVITIVKMTKTNRFLKIFNIADGIIREFGNSELKNVEIIEQIATEELPINEATLDIIPFNNTGVMFQRTLPMEIYRDDVLYGKFFINSSTSNYDKTAYKVKIDDYINVLDGQKYVGGLYADITVSDLIAEIMGDIPYEIETNTIGDLTITGYLPIMTRREALQQVAFITNALVDCSRNDKVYISSLPTTSSQTITKDKILSIETTQENIVTQMVLQTTLLATKGASADNLFSAKLNGTTTVIFDQPTFNLSITNGTIVESNINYAVISGTGQTVTLTGKTYQQSVKQDSKSNSHVVTTDIEKTETYQTTLTCSSPILDQLQFVESKIKAKFKMGTVKVGDMITLNGTTCRVKTLDYEIDQTNIYCSAELEAYYE